MVNGDILEIVSRGSVSGNSVLNVYHMRVTDVDVAVGGDPLGPAQMTALLNINYELLIEDMLAWCNNSVKWHGIDVRNLFNVNEVNSLDYATDYTGSAVGDATANFVAARITSTRKIYGMHGGRKSLPPVTEASVQSNSLTGGLIASLGVMVTKWNTINYTVDEVGAAYTLKPVIVKRLKVATGNPKRPYNYPLPTSQAEATYYVADNWKVESLVGSANSRKVGQGS